MKDLALSTSSGLVSSDDLIDVLISYKLASVTAATSRIYNQSYRCWLDWCSDYHVNPMDFQPEIIRAFLSAQPVTKKTRQRHLNALRGLVEMAALRFGGDYQRLYDMLKKLRVPEDGAGGSEREKHVLSPKQVVVVMSAWDEDSNMHCRNRALVGTLFYVGARRAEIVALQWRDIDLDEGVILIRHGKGDKERDAAILGDDAINALSAWRERCAGRTYVFCAINKGDNLLGDTPISGEAVRLVTKRTEQVSGIIFRPHDARRTLITEIIISGGNVRDAQMQAGHADEATTLKYVQKADARTRKGRIRLRY